MEDWETYREAEKAFGSGDDEGLPEVAFHLTPQEMEVLRRCCWERDVHVDVRRTFVHLIRIVR